TTGQEIAFVPFAKGAQGSVQAFNGKTVAVNSRRGRMTVFDVSAPETVRHLDRPDYDPRCVALSPDGKYLAIGSDHDYGVLIYDLVRGEPVRHITGKDTRRNFILGLAFAPDSRSLVFSYASEPSMLVQWDLETHRP